MKLNLKSLLIIPYVLLSFSVNAQWYKEIVEEGTGVVTNIGEAYQNLAQPVVNTASELYSNTFKQPVDNLKAEITNAIPSDVTSYWKTEIDSRLGPLVDNYIGIAKGDINIVDGVNNILQSGINLSKELYFQPELMSIYTVALSKSEPVPASHLNAIQPYWNQSTNRTFRNNEVRYVVSTDLIISIENLFETSVDAFTINNVIIFKSPIGCDIVSLSLLGHEMVHVDQYKQEGYLPFLAKYISDYINKKDYYKISAEVEAYDVQNKLNTLLKGNNFTFPEANNIANFEVNTSKISMNFSGIDAMGVNPASYAQAKLMYEKSNLTRDDINSLIGFVFQHKGITPDQISAVCISAAIGPNSKVLSMKDQQYLAQTAVAVNPNSVVNWYYLAYLANQQNNNKVEYDALISLSNIILCEELNKPVEIRNNNRVINTCNFLIRAVFLGNQMNWNYKDFYDIRIPLMMLVKIGLNYPVSYYNDSQMLEYTKQVYDIDTKMNILDDLHFQVILINAQVNLRWASNEPDFPKRQKAKFNSDWFCKKGIYELQNSRPFWSDVERNLFNQFSQIQIDVSQIY